jgi:hypothetical protein
MPILDYRYYAAIGLTRCIRIQRWFTKQHAELVKQFLKPLCDRIGIWLVYEIDDVLLYDEIPKYNMAKEHYSPEVIGDSVKEIFDCCDLITVTTTELKDLYVSRLNQPANKIIVIPNYLPRWWIGETFSLDRQLAQWDAQHTKPHIVFACSTNHFDVNNVNGGVDDFTHIMPWIKANVKKYHFAFIGGLPQQLTEEAKNGLVETQPPSDIFNYPREMLMRKVDLLVAPLIDNEFNRCKSNIKWLEMSALGIPMIGQNICTYNKFTDQVFTTADDIEEWIDKLFFRKDSKDRVAEMLTKNRKLIDGVTQKDGYWLEKNIHAYYNLYTLQQKTLHIKL